MFEYNAKVHRVVDGDTIDLDVDCGFHIINRIRTRLAFVDTPELRGEERPAGLVAKEFVVLWLESSRVVDDLPNTVRVKTSKTGKYGRWIAQIFNHGGEDLGEALRANGLLDES